MNHQKVVRHMIEVLRSSPHQLTHGEVMARVFAKHPELFRTHAGGGILSQDHAEGEIMLETLAGAGVLTSKFNLAAEAYQLPEQEPRPDECDDCRGDEGARMWCNHGVPRERARGVLVKPPHAAVSALDLSIPTLRVELPGDRFLEVTIYPEDEEIVIKGGGVALTVEQLAPGNVMIKTETVYCKGPNGLRVRIEPYAGAGDVGWTSKHDEARGWKSEEAALAWLDENAPRVAEWARTGVCKFTKHASPDEGP